jgi:hypothetical protein
MSTRSFLHFAATTSMCCASFVAGALYAGESKPASGNEAAAIADDEAEDTIDLAKPADSIEIPPGRPDWVGETASYTGEVHRIPVASGPYATEKQSRRALDTALVSATSEYFTDQLGPHAARAMRYDARAIKQRLVKTANTYHDVARYSVGPMHEHFALLEIGPEFRNEIKARFRKSEAAGRLKLTGVFAGASLVVLAGLFVTLRLPCRKEA